ncbi:MAG: A/G-specific adenine glycosylase [Candidatus Pacebacteria bacterium]|nr:A/G-specific adenine glycosylase [Candidatus Paceibacterota bacterium]PIR61169.1 MAG: endonuclease III [Candidatus Pacebacteria bacterium CG10_big_fil_rev_8_21_14_0_10_45_6]
MTNRQKSASFQHYLLNWYSIYGRHDLPWRQTTDPYHILVSELMLQQTQVERVIPKYLAFIKEFPSFSKLAQAEQSEVIELWQGLGYNRRARYLHQCAQQVAGKTFPKTLKELEQLPGIGPYTATAICAFSYNQPVIMLETNIRTVFLYHFFPGQTSVKDSDLIPYIIKTLDTQNPREWYWALMDYGSVLKKLTGNHARRSSSYTKQSKFAGSLRQVRGEIIRLLTQASELTEIELQTKITGDKRHFPDAFLQLQKEGMIRHGKKSTSGGCRWHL